MQGRIRSRIGLLYTAAIIRAVARGRVTAGQRLGHILGILRLSPSVLVNTITPPLIRQSQTIQFFSALLLALLQYSMQSRSLAKRIPYAIVLQQRTAFSLEYPSAIKRLASLAIAVSLSACKRILFTSYYIFVCIILLQKIVKAKSSSCIYYENLAFLYRGSIAIRNTIYILTLATTQLTSYI